MVCLIFLLDTCTVLVQAASKVLWPRNRCRVRHASNASSMPFRDTTSGEREHEPCQLLTLLVLSSNLLSWQPDIIINIRWSIYRERYRYRYRYRYMDYRL